MQRNVGKQIATNLRGGSEACCQTWKKSARFFWARARNFALLDFEKSAYDLGGVCAESRQISAGGKCLDGLPGCKVG
jgi:hypothetical protein